MEFAAVVWISAVVWIESKDELITFSLCKVSPGIGEEGPL
jgi:hypothetical protein